MKRADMGIGIVEIAKKYKFGDKGGLYSLRG